MTIPEICQNISKWHTPSREEALAFLESRKNKGQSGLTGHHWSITSRITPLAMYTYLKARFAKPNGFAMALKKPRDVDNLIHWEYQLSFGGHTILIDGFTFYFTVLISDVERMTEKDQKIFLDALLKDFSVHSKGMARERRGLEKWNVFLNPYYQYSQMVLDLYKKIEEINLPAPAKRPKSKAELSSLGKPAERLHEAFSHGTTLKLIIPIWIESFVNLLIFAMTKPAFRKNAQAFRTFRRLPFFEKIRSLHVHCHGFESGVTGNEDEVKAIEPLFKNRNKLLHGNVEPLLSDERAVYFDDRTIPLFDRNIYSTEFVHGLLMKEVDLGTLDKEVCAGEGFIELILSKLTPKVFKMFTRIMAENTPGWDSRRGIPGCILPEIFVDSFIDHEDSQAT